VTDGGPTTQITVNGGAFLPNEQMTLYWDQLNKVAGSGVADGSGNFVTHVKPFSGDAPGVHKLCASVPPNPCANFTLEAATPTPSAATSPFRALAAPFQWRCCGPRWRAGRLLARCLGAAIAIVTLGSVARAAVRRTLGPALAATVGIALAATLGIALAATLGIALAATLGIALAATLGITFTAAT